MINLHGGGDSIQQIDYNLPAETHSPMYSMHKYWARKPHNVVAEYINAYSEEGDIVLDPFSGSGVAGIEALHLGRKAVIIDLDPVAVFIARMTAIPIDIEEFDSAFREITNKVKEKILDLYKTKCSICGNKNAIISHVVWQEDAKDYAIEKPLKIWYNCSVCEAAMRKGIKSKYPDKGDLDKIESINNQPISFWYPKDTKLMYNGTPFMKKEKRDYIWELFSKRNLMALSILYNEIENIKNNKIRNMMKFTFTSFIAKSSKLNFVNVGGYSSKGRGWTVHSYWVPPEHFEQNVWVDFENAYKDVRKGKEESNDWSTGKKYWVAIKGEGGGMFLKKNNQISQTDKIIKRIKPLSFKEAKDFNELINSDKTVLIATHNALDLVNEPNLNKSFIQPESIDYVFTDPPYGGSIQYFELSTLWGSWLKGRDNDDKFDMDFNEEVTINEKQSKGFDEYDLMLNKAFRQIFRVLKTGKYTTVTFHNTDIKIRNSLIRSVVYSGFNLDKILYQTPAKPSFKGLMQPYGSAVGDYYIRFYKPIQQKGQTRADIDSETQDKIIVESVKKILAERGEPTAYPWIQNTIDTELAKRGFSLISNPEDVAKVLNKHLGKEFVVVDVNEGSKRVKKWWFADPKIIAHYEIPLSERLEKTIVDILRREVTVTFDDIVREIFIRFPNSYTPEMTKIKDILKTYAIQVKDGKWQLSKASKKEIGIHNMIEASLAKIGKGLGFDVWTADNVNAVEDIVEKKLMLKMPEERSKRVKEIDVLWIKNGMVKYSFEVENSTNITEAIIRGSNIEYGTNRFIVIPKRRFKLLLRKFEEPMIKDRIQKEKWDVITYEQVDELLDKKYVKVEDLADMAKATEKRFEQKHL